MIRLSALFGVVLLAACAGGATLVQPVQILGGYVPLEVRAVAPAMPVEIRGAPPDGSDAAAVAAALRMPADMGGRGMTPVGPDHDGLRVVIGFGAAGAGNLCLPPTGPAPAGGRADRLEAGLALCRGAARLTAVTRMTSSVTRGPSDDRFTAAMRTGLSVLMPPFRPDIDRPARWMF